jgi:cytochrome c-type biogenesis protein CcmE
MKISHIIGVIIIGIAIAAIVSTTGDASTYVTFKEAADMAQEGKTTKVHVVGSLVKDPNGKIMGLTYNPKIDPNYFSFKLLDDSLQEREVVYLSPKPQDFERSEKIVIIGCMKHNTFVADKILLKCPSKYQDSKVDVKGASLPTTSVSSSPKSNS